jgi:hypothetical protein
MKDSQPQDPCTQVTLLAVGGIPHPVAAAATMLLGPDPDSDRSAAVASAAAASIDPASDLHTAAFRPYLSAVLTWRAW